MKPFSEKTITSLLRWYHEQPELERKECHEIQRQRINVMMNDARKSGSKPVADGGIYYRAFLDGIASRNRLQDNRRLRSDDDLEAVTNIRIIVEKGKLKLKPSPKLDRLHGDLGPVVQRMRNDGLSWSKVSDYLAKNHTFKCGRAYLQKVFVDQ